MRSGAELLGVLLDARYRVDAVIARGGMSTVYRGIDLRLDRPVAIKVMDPSFAGDPAFLSRFELEARSVARLSHAGLVAVYDQGRDDGHVFLVMELVEGGTLRGLLREHGALSVPLAFSVLEPVLAALATAHRAGLVHRDVKPENVLIATDGAVKLADFGLVRAVAAANATASSVIMGTAGYLSPEQVVPGTSDARSDVYSAGVLLYEMLTGAPPYSGGTALSVAYQHVNTDTSAPSERFPGLPPELDDLVLRATRRDPAARFPDAGAMLAEVLELRRWLHIAAVRVPVPASEHRASDSGQATVAVGHTRAMATEMFGTGGTTESGRLPTESDYGAARRRARRSAVVWIVVVLLLAGAVGVGGWWLGSWRFTAVPDLTGLPSTRAEQLLADAHLMGLQHHGYDNAAPVDRVLDARPGAGSKVARGSTVELMVSLGRPVVPTIAAGTSSAATQEQLATVTLLPQNAPATYSETVPTGTLLSLDPRPGTALQVGATVRVTLSRGPAPVAVPDVRGRTTPEATAALVAAGLTVERSAPSFSADVAGGAVIATAPQAGTTLPRGSAVTLQVSNAVTVPGMTGHTVGTAKQQLAELGLQPTVRQLVPFDGSLVVGQSVAAGTRVAPASAVSLTALP